MSSSYFANTMNPHVDVARYDTSRHIASASNYSDGFTYANYNSECYVQMSLSNNMHALNFNSTSNIQHAPINSHASAVQQVQRPMSDYQGQTNMVSSASLYG